MVGGGGGHGAAAAAAGGGGGGGGVADGSGALGPRAARKAAEAAAAAHADAEVQRARGAARRERERRDERRRASQPGRALVLLRTPARPVGAAHGFVFSIGAHAAPVRVVALRVRVGDDLSMTSALGQGDLDAAYGRPIECNVFSCAGEWADAAAAASPAEGGFAGGRGGGLCGGRAAWGVGGRQHGSGGRASMYKGYGSASHWEKQGSGRILVADSGGLARIALAAPVTVQPWSVVSFCAHCPESAQGVAHGSLELDEAAAAAAAATPLQQPGEPASAAAEVIADDFGDAHVTIFPGCASNSAKPFAAVQSGRHFVLAGALEYSVEQAVGGRQPLAQQRAAAGAPEF